MFSPLSVGLASSRVPLPLTPYSARDAVVLGVRLLQLAHQRVGVAQRRARRQLDRHLEAVLRQLRDQVGAQHRHHQQRQRRTRSRGDPSTSHGCSQRGRQQLAGSRVRRGRTAPSPGRWPCASPGRPPRPGRARRARPARRCRRQRHAAPAPMPCSTAATGFCQLRRRLPLRMRRLFRERHRRRGPSARSASGSASSTRPARSPIAIATVSAWSRNSWPAMPCTNTSGRNTAIVVSVEATTAMLTSRVPAIAASRMPRPRSRALAMRFQHHDRVVHHQAGGQRQAAQRHHVEAQAELVHEEERGDDRHRQRQADRRTCSSRRAGTGR